MPNLKASLRATVETTETTGGRLFDGGMQFLIVASLLGVRIRNSPNLSSGQIQFLVAIEFLCVLAFTVEYFLRIWVAEKKASYFQLLRDDRSSRYSSILSINWCRQIASCYPASPGYCEVLKLIRFNEAIRIDVAFNLAKAELALSYQHQW